MKKMVVMMNVYDERSKERVFRTVASCSGLTTISMDVNEGKLTVIGDMDEMKILTKLKRRWRNAKMATYGPYDAKREAEIAAEKKRKEEMERERSEALYRSHHENSIYPMHHHSSVVCDHDHHGCVIS